MVRIIHVSDLHLESETLSAEKTSLISALANDLKDYVDNNTVLLFTGDLINKGGSGFADKRRCFDVFEEKFINVILDANPKLVGKIFCIPGNHDLFREKVDRISESGLRAELTDEQSVSKFIIENRNVTRHIEQLSDYKLWETKFYSTYGPTKNLSNFDNSFIIRTDQCDVGISCLNSSWLCRDGEEDKERLIIGKNQIENSLGFIKDCQVKLALSHHPLEYLTQFDRESIKNELYFNYDIFFIGHVHELGSSYIHDLVGNMFVSVANSATGDNPLARKYVNGYAIFDLNPGNSITVSYRKYLETHKKFVANTDVGSNDGKRLFPILKDEKLQKFQDNLALVSKIENSHLSRLNDHIIMSANSTSANCSIESLFVEPTLLNMPEGEAIDEQEVKKYSIESILTQKTNFLLYGIKESGKTILLDKFFIDAIKGYNQLNKIPIYLRFSDFKTRSLDKVLREFLSMSNSDMEKLLSENDVVMFIDDMNFTERSDKQLDSLKQFVGKFPRLQIVATCDSFSEKTFPTDYLSHNNILKFELGFIQSFNSNQIKTLIAKWFNGKEVDFQENMEKLMKSFMDFGLPKTPLSVTLFLWIFEKQEKRPINNSVLVELFIENLLEKTNAENLYSETFDFTNKKRLLSFIAKFMKDKGEADLSYRVGYVELLNFVNDYLRTRFPGQPQKVLDDLLKRGILYLEGENTVKFKSAFFFHYFLALQFDYDPKFKSSILRDDIYLNYKEEIVYYTGLKRDNREILEFTQNKLQDALGDIIQELRQNGGKIDDEFETQKIGTLTHLMDFDRVKSKPSQQQIDEIYDEQLANIPVKNNIPNKDNSRLSTSKNIDIVLNLAANVLKNSEDVDDFELKKKSFNEILLGSIATLLLYRASLIGFYSKYQKKPEHFPKNIDFNLYIRALPLVHQIVLYNWVGSPKLRPVIIEKIQEDRTSLGISEYEKLLSIFMYSDIRGSDYPEHIKSFIKNVKFNYVKDLTFMKIMSYYHLRNNSKDLDEFYLTLLSEIKEDLGHLNKTKKGEFKTDLEKRKLFRRV